MPFTRLSISPLQKVKFLHCPKRRNGNCWMLLLSTAKKPKLLIHKRRMNTKRLIALLTTVVVTAVSSAFSSPDATAEESHHDNVLITYFSRAGENYNVGVVERGNTDLLAEIVAEETGGELFRIETVREYSSAYDEMLTVATEERTNKERPELKTSGVTM